MKLNLGYGWINVDYALEARITKLPLFKFLNRKLKIFSLDWNKNIYIHNLLNKFPWNNNSIDIIYSSHTVNNHGQRPWL